MLTVLLLKLPHDLSFFLNFSDLLLTDHNSSELEPLAVDLTGGLRLSRGLTDHASGDLLLSRELLAVDSTGAWGIAGTVVDLFLGFVVNVSVILILYYITLLYILCCKLL